MSRSVEAAIRAFNEKVQEAAEDEFRARCIALSNAAISLTPVDTGRLRANWQAAQYSAPDGLVDFAGDPGDPANGPRASAIAVRNIKNTVNKMQNKQIFYLTNNLPYAQAVERGIGQRPRRMLARAILRASKQF